MALVVKKLPANTGDIRGIGSIPGLRRPPGEGHANPLQYSSMENPTDRSLAGCDPQGFEELDTTEVT